MVLKIQRRRLPPQRGRRRRGVSMKEKEVPELKVIARIHSDFSGKFGIPRQSGLVEELESAVVFEPEYRREDALRGIEDFTHLWLIGGSTGRCGSAGPPRCGRPGWGATPAWGSLPPGPPSGPIPSDCRR